MYTSFLTSVINYNDELIIQKSVENELLWGIEDEELVLNSNSNADSKE